MGNKLLGDLRVGEKALIDYIEPSYLKRRLQDLGMIHGNSILCIMSSLSKETLGYQIQDTVIALRKEDALRVHVYD